MHDHALSHMFKQEKSAVHCPHAFENCQIFFEGRSEKHFLQYAVGIPTRQI